MSKRVEKGLREPTCSAVLLLTLGLRIKSVGIAATAVVLEGQAFGGGYVEVKLDTATFGSFVFAEFSRRWC